MNFKFATYEAASLSFLHQVERTNQTDDDTRFLHSRVCVSSEFQDYFNGTVFT